MAANTTRIARLAADFHAMNPVYGEKTALNATIAHLKQVPICCTSKETDSHVRTAMKEISMTRTPNQVPLNWAALNMIPLLEIVPQIAINRRNGIALTVTIIRRIPAVIWPMKIAAMNVITSMSIPTTQLWLPGIFA